MVRCFRRSMFLVLVLRTSVLNLLLTFMVYKSLYIYKMPNKPITQGYKIYRIVDYSYLYNFI
jgi:hypothetical protein